MPKQNSREIGKMVKTEAHPFRMVDDTRCVSHISPVSNRSNKQYPRNQRTQKTRKKIGNLWDCDDCDGRGTQ